MGKYLKQTNAKLKLPTEPEIFKLQWPLQSTHPAGILLYNESRSIQEQIPPDWIPKNIRNQLQQLLKVYVIGHVNKDGQLVIAHMTENPGW